MPEALCASYGPGLRPIAANARAASPRRGLKRALESRKWRKIQQKMRQIPLWLRYLPQIAPRQFATFFYGGEIGNLLPSFLVISNFPRNTALLRAHLPLENVEQAVPNSLLFFAIKISISDAFAVDVSEDVLAMVC